MRRLQVLSRGHAENQRAAAEKMPFLPQEQAEKARIRTELPPEGRRLVRDGFQIRPGEEAQSGCRERAGSQACRGGQERSEARGSQGERAGERAQGA